MDDKVLWIGFTDENGSLDKPSLEALTATRTIAEGIDGELAIGLVGGSVDAAAAQIGGAGATRVVALAGEAWAAPRYASDTAACAQIARTVDAGIVVATAGSRFNRVCAGLAQRLGGAVDTQITDILVENGALSVSRWFYRQRMIGKLQRTVRPWVLSIASGSFVPCEAGDATVTPIEIEGFESRTEVLGVEAGTGGSQTIRPDAETLLVAGAGWTKKQADGEVHTDDAASIILEFVESNRASLGSSKSMVDLATEGQAVLPFLTHLHQIGQTGASPRHAKGLSTCCHGEEPHAVGWRFINERRAINTDANCGWAQGKADVLYVADAFEVMKKVNERLAD
ncbi:MAG: electron transfer flavoprotein subunit alpha [Verrucomicrobia bacterium]|nr:MAG: electron transfer flavoprotein subunit alpha [Verrucomicrobiota bacterium]